MLSKDFDETAADAIGKSSTAAIIIVAALVAMQTLGFSIASLLAFGGVAGIALGFAAQGLVANLLGGITIYASRPFKVGDHIILPDASLMGNAQYIGWQAGEVQHIGWRATRILDWNGKPFYVPNAKFNTQTIINHSRMSFRQISESVYVRLEDIDKVPGIVTDVNRMLEEHPEMGDYLIFRFDSYGQYALKLYLYAYTAGTVTAYTDYMRVKQDLLLRIAAIIAQHDAKLAVPVSTVYLPEGPALRREHEPHGTGPASAGIAEPDGTKH
jgi:MscS family membrane protein